MKESIAKINAKIAPKRAEIIAHPLYQVIKDIEDVRIFMKYHVYAVWDFMSLLKSLQNLLTCTQMPWFPTGNPETRFLINEIVVGEESDIDEEGTRMSHFELYLKSMKRCGAKTEEIELFIEKLKQTKSFAMAYEHAKTPLAAQNFVNYTFDIINSKKDYLIASIFTFGREDLIPDMFLSIVQDLDKKLPDTITTFKYYLERHIEVDGDHHSHLAIQMVENLCGTDESKWNEVIALTSKSLDIRKQLWDGAYEEILAKNATLHAQS
jgi:hypothetical protein